MERLEKIIRIVNHEMLIYDFTKLFPEDDTDLLKDLRRDGFITESELKVSLEANKNLKYTRQAIKADQS